MSGRDCSKALYWGLPRELAAAIPVANIHNVSPPSMFTRFQYSCQYICGSAPPHHPQMTRVILSINRNQSASMIINHYDDKDKDYSHDNDDDEDGTGEDGDDNDDDDDDTNLCLIQGLVLGFRGKILLLL